MNLRSLLVVLLFYCNHSFREYHASSLTVSNPTGEHAIDAVLMELQAYIDHYHQKPGSTLHMPTETLCMLP